MKSWILILRRCLLAGLVLASFSGLPGEADANEKVALQLRFDHQFQFAGYYAAKWQGYYENAGIDVDILPGVRPDGIMINAPDTVGKGAAEFGVGSGDILLAIDRGVALVILASIFQQSPVEIFARQDVGLSSPADLTRLKVLGGQSPLVDAEVSAMLRAEGVDPNKVKFIRKHEFMTVPAFFESLLDGDVDAILGYALSTPWHAKERGITLTRLRPSVYGVDFYGDSLFVNRRLIEEKPELVERFTTASIKGWRYALEHPEEIIERIAAELPRNLPVSDLRSYNRFLSETVRELMLYPVVEIGHINPARWQKMYDAMDAAGLVKNPLNIDELIFDPEKIRSARRTRKLIIAVAFLIGLTALLIAVSIRARLKYLAGRKLAEKKLRQSEQSYRKLIETANDAIFVADAETGKIIIVNKKAVELIGMPADQLIGMHQTELHPVENIEYYSKIFQSHAREGKGILRDVLVSHSDGHQIPVEISASVTTIGGKRTIQGIFRDVTDLRRAEEALRNSEEKHRTLFETMEEGVVYQDSDGRITSANHAAERILGLTLSQMQGRTSIDPRWKAIHEDGSDFPGDEHPTMIALKTGEPVRNVTMGIYNPGRKEYNWLTINAVPLFRPGERRPGQAYATFIDITERRHLEEESLKAQKLESLGVLAGGIAHDFNNLLTGVIGNLSLAERMIGKDGDAYKRLLEVDKSALQAKGLAQQLLTFSRGGEPVKAIVSVGELLQETVYFALRGSNVRCSCCDLPEDLWNIDADEAQISQVINNLTINADQAMPEGGVLKVSAENRVIGKKDRLPLKDGRYVMLSFEDHGIGITEALLPKIFDPYFTTKKKGSGLGLASTYSIVKKHGGHIDVSSETGAGTTFNIYLPALEREPVVKERLEQELLHITGGRVLIMDDEEVIRDVTGEMLTALGYEVTTAAEGDETIRLYKEAMDKGEPFDLVIMDLTISGGVGGKEAIKKLLEIDPAARTVVSSGYSNDPVLASFKRYGFKGVIVKPYKVEELSAVVHKVLEGEADEDE